MKQHIMTSIKPCPQWLEKLNALHPEDLSPEERAQLSKHLETCRHCQAVKDEYAAINARILGLPRAAPLPALPARLQQVMSIDPENEQPLADDIPRSNDILQTLPSFTPGNTTTKRRRSRLKSKLNLAAAVMVVAALLGSFLFLLNTRQPGSGNIATTGTNLTRLYLITAGQDGQTNKVLYEINPENGNIVWQRALDNVLEGYGISAGSNLYLPAQDGNVYAYSGSNGQPLWQSNLSIHQGPDSMIGVGLMAYQHLIIDSITNRSNDNGDLYALNAQTGAVVWHTPITCAASSSNDCAGGETINLLANGIIYGLADDGISAWKAVNGHFLWRNPRYQANGQPQSMVVSHGKLYITNFYPEVDVLDASTGRFLHRLRPPEPNNSAAVVYAIAASGNTVYILGGGTVSAYRTSNDSLLWKQQFSYHSGGDIYASKSVIYVSDYNIILGGNLVNIKNGQAASDNAPGNDLYALRPDNGQQIWHSSLPSSPSNAYPVEVKDMICLGGLNSAYGLRASDGTQIWQISKGRFVDDLFAG